MKVPGFLKKKRTYIILVILALIGWGIYARTKSAGAPKYETFTVERTTLLDTTDATGEIKPVARINLSFGAPGQVGAINVKVGQQVKKGDILAELNAKDVTFAYDSASASLSAAQAQLNLALAGAKDQNVRISQAGVTQAGANLDKAKTELNNAKITTQVDVENAALALKTATDALNIQTIQLDQDITDAYDNARAGYLNALAPMQTALSDGDAIVGVDDQVTNASYKFQLGVTAAGSMEQAKASYYLAKAARVNAETKVDALRTSSTHAEIDAAGDAVVNSVTLVQQYLNDVTNVLAGSISGSSLSATSLTALKTAITTDRAAVATLLTTDLGLRQGTTGAVLTHDQTMSKLTDAVETAKLNLKTAQSEADTSVSSADVGVKVQDAALTSAQAQLDLTKAPPRTVDLDPLYASVASARATFDKAAADLRDAQIIAPVDGVVSAVNPQLDERVTTNQTIVTMLSGDTYDIEVLIPEADVANIKTNQSATTTLDAYGDNVGFPGTVESIEPDQTLVQDAVYYKARVSIVADGHEIKPGMTANTTILVGQSSPDALVIPARAVTTGTDGKTSVKILGANNQTRDVVVDLGMKGDEGRVVVLKGLSEGDVIVVSQ
jgi:HlyD family secretion protein